MHVLYHTEKWTIKTVVLIYRFYNIAKMDILWCSIKIHSWESDIILYQKDESALMITTVQATTFTLYVTQWNSVEQWKTFHHIQEKKKDWIYSKRFFWCRGRCQWW